MVVRDVLGRERAVEQVWEGPSWTCPFCGAGVVPRSCSWSTAARPCDGLHCPAPACTANPHLPVEAARRLVEEAERRRAEAERRKLDHQAAMARIEAEREREEALWVQLVEEAERRGACRRCLRASGWRWGRPRFVRHRAGCPEERR